MNHLIDAHMPEELTLAQCEAIDQHLGTCRACREDMAAFREVAALQVPATPVELRTRIAAALPVQQVVAARRMFRPYVIGGVLLAGTALAAAIGLQLAGRELQSAPPVAGRLDPVAPAAAATTQSPLPVSPANAEAATAPVAATAGKAEVHAAADKPLDPHRILVVKVTEAAADVSDIALMERCHDGMVRELRNLGGVDVVTGAAAYRTTSIEDQMRLASRLQRDAHDAGAGKVLTVSTSMGCDAILFSSVTGRTVQGAGGGGVDPQGGRVEAFAKSMASTVRARTLLDAGAEIAAARATLLDASLADGQRAAALWVPIRLDPAYTTATFRSFYDSEVLAAAASIGVKSKDAQARSAVWAVLRKVNDPALVQPLLQVLASDDDASVRYQAALSLNIFLDQPGVREALLRAAAQDPQREPEVPCCMLTVREAAQRAAVANQDFREWVRQTLLDESLPTRSRLLSLQNSSPDGRFPGISVADFGSDAARVVFDMGRREQDPQLRAMAWNTLWRAAPDDSFLPVLISDLASHASELVRARAARVLAGQVSNPDVRVALERALNDSSIDVRRYASEALAAAGK
jgi:hypothetical protein